MGNAYVNNVDLYDYWFARCTFVQVYTNGISDANDYIVPGFALIMSIAIAARCIQMPYNVVVQAAGHFKETQASAIIEPVVNIMISVIMVFKFGLVGVAIGTLVSMIYRVLYLAFYLMKNIIYIKAGSFFKQLLADSMSAFYYGLFSFLSLILMLTVILSG